MFAEFLKQNEFYQKYMQLFTFRFTVGNLEMEDSKTEITDSNRAIEMYNNMNAFMKLIERNPDKLTPFDVIETADLVNKDIEFFQKGYRKTQVDVKKAKYFFPVPAREVPSKMYALFNAYNNIWCDLPVYEKEARFNIELVRLQPFEDGNKRTSRIIMNYNLCKQNKAPVVISGKDNDEYFRCIDEYDVESLTKLIKEKSENELEVIINLFRSICGDEIVSECDEKDAKISTLMFNRDCEKCKKLEYKKSEN